MVAVASSALFDLAESDTTYRQQGVEAFRRHQRANLDKPSGKGVAFPFIRRLSVRVREAFNPIRLSSALFVPSRHRYKDPHSMTEDQPPDRSHG